MNPLLALSQDYVPPDVVAPLALYALVSVADELEMSNQAFGRFLQDDAGSWTRLAFVGDDLLGVDGGAA